MTKDDDYIGASVSAGMGASFTYIPPKRPHSGRRAEAARITAEAHRHGKQLRREYEDFEKFRKELCERRDGKYYLRPKEFYAQMLAGLSVEIEKAKLDQNWETIKKYESRREEVEKHLRQAGYYARIHDTHQQETTKRLEDTLLQISSRLEKLEQMLTENLA